MRLRLLALDHHERRAAIERSGLLDAPRDQAFEVVVGLAAELLDAPVALLSVVTSDRQFFKSATGLAEPWAHRRGTPLSHSFCRHVVESATAFVVDDARTTVSVRDNPAIRDLGVIAYVGVPVALDGIVIGSLCAIDRVPRVWRESEIADLHELAMSLHALYAA